MGTTDSRCQNCNHEHNLHKDGVCNHHPVIYPSGVVCDTCKHKCDRTQEIHGISYCCYVANIDWTVTYEKDEKNRAENKNEIPSIAYDKTGERFIVKKCACFNKMHTVKPYYDTSKLCDKKCKECKCEACMKRLQSKL